MGPLLPLVRSLDHLYHSWFTPINNFCMCMCVVITLREKTTSKFKFDLKVSLKTYLIERISISRKRVSRTRVTGVEFNFMRLWSRRLTSRNRRRRRRVGPNRTTVDGPFVTLQFRKFGYRHGEYFV